MTVLLTCLLPMSAWRGYPQILPPISCSCDEQMGSHLQRLRDGHRLASQGLPEIVSMLYAFGPEMLRVQNISGSATLPSLTTTASLQSLARVTVDQAAGGAAAGPTVMVMLCPHKHSVLRSLSTAGARFSSSLLEYECPRHLVQELHSCHTVLMERIRVAMLEAQHASSHNGSKPLPRVAFVELDQLWLGPPAAIFAGTQTFAERNGTSHYSPIPLQLCDLVLTVHDTTSRQRPYSLNSGVMLVRNTQAVRDFFDRVAVSVRRAVRRDGCIGGQNQAVIMHELGLSITYNPLRPGQSRVTRGGLRVCALSCA